MVFVLQWYSLGMCLAPGDVTLHWRKSWTRSKIFVPCSHMLFRRFSRALCCAHPIQMRRLDFFFHAAKCVCVYPALLYREDAVRPIQNNRAQENVHLHVAYPHHQTPALTAFHYNTHKDTHGQPLTCIVHKQSSLCQCGSQRLKETHTTTTTSVEIMLTNFQGHSFLKKEFDQEIKNPQKFVECKAELNLISGFNSSVLSQFHICVYLLSLKLCVCKSPDLSLLLYLPWSD